MNGHQQILSWLNENVKGMHGLRRNTLAAVVFACMSVQAVGVLRLGRAMAGTVSAKHCIKRVWRFLANRKVETELVSAALLRTFGPALNHRLIVVADWTDLEPYEQLVFALPRDGRAIPILCETIVKSEKKGNKRAAERRALRRLRALCGRNRQVIMIADRGFGNGRWLNDIKGLGWQFVQRLSGEVCVEVDKYQGALNDLRVHRGGRSRDLGWGTVIQTNPVPGRVTAVFAEEAKEPWYLVCNLKHETPAALTRLYKRRMWIEGMFRDWKNSEWGLSLSVTRLSSADRHNRLFVVVALAYTFLVALGAKGEREGYSATLKANTVRERVMTLLRIGIEFLRKRPPRQLLDFKPLRRLPI